MIRTKPINRTTMMPSCPTGADYYWRTGWYKVKGNRVFRYDRHRWVSSTITIKELVKGTTSCDGFAVKVEEPTYAV